MVIGVLGTTRFLWARAITTVFVETFRGIAALVVMFWFVFAFPDLTGFELDPIFAAILALGLNVGAYGEPQGEDRGEDPIQRSEEPTPELQSRGQLVCP